jgi:hypothetical protein
MSRPGEVGVAEGTGHLFDLCFLISDLPLSPSLSL